MQHFSLYILLMIATWVPAFDVQASEKLSLADYLAAVKAANLDIQSQQYAYEASSSASHGLSIPPPMVGVMQMQDGSAKPATGFEISQEIPFPSKLSNDLKVRQSEEHLEHFNLLSMRNEIIAEARLAFFRFWKSSEEKILLLQKKSILKVHINLTRSRVRSDSAMALHLIDAESDLDLLENELIDADRRIAEARFTVATLQGISSKGYDVEPIEPALSELSKTDTTENYQTQAAEALVTASKAKESDAKSALYPDFNIRVRSFEKTSMTPATQEYMVGLTLPFIFFGKPNADIGKASALRQKSEVDLQKTMLDVESAKLTSQTRAESLLKQIHHLDEVVIPKAEKRMKLIHNLVPRDMESLQDHRGATESLVELKLKRLEMRLQYEEAAAVLNRYEAEGSP